MENETPTQAGAPTIDQLADQKLNQDLNDWKVGKLARTKNKRLVLLRGLLDKKAELDKEFEANLKELDEIDAEVKSLNYIPREDSFLRA